MATQENRKGANPIVLTGEAGLLLSAPDVAARIENFVQTREGTLKSIEGPLPFVPKDEAKGSYPMSYNLMHGIFHTTLRGGAVDILLLHAGNSIYSYRGWKPDDPWEKLVGVSGGQIDIKLVNNNSPQFPTQFEATPTGVVIVPQGSRAFFYNGEVILPLGYSEVPASLQGYGPQTTDSYTPNGAGYSVGRHGDSAFAQHIAFGFGRVGTVGPVRAVTSGSDLEWREAIFPSSYQASYQWIDYFGNLSALASRSNALKIFEDTAPNDASAVKGSTAAIAMKHLLWGGIAKGRTGTVGRVLCRTRDMLNSGTQKLFIVPGNVGVTATGTFATIPDNLTEVWPDNTPDVWCIGEPRDVQPVPQFKLCRLAFGRLWIANTTADPGILIPSMPGRYGTFLVGEEMFPDPSGGEITGLWTVPAGMLVFTATSTFLLTQSDDGQGFRLTTINANVGCVAPSSCASLPDGTAIWLGREGFYALTPQGVQLISAQLDAKINTPRAKAACAIFDPEHKEYRCWVATDISDENDTCYVFNGSDWRKRIHEKLASVCVTKDHRSYVLGAGTVIEGSKETGLLGLPLPITEATNDNGVWLLDHSHSQWLPVTPTALIETNWITWTSSQSRKSMKTIYLALRESYNGSATLKVYRDWRKTSTPAYEDTNVTLHPVDDLPPFWDVTAYGADEWVKRRPYWKRIDISLPACEVFKFILETTSPIEFIGFAFDEEPKLGGMATRIT